MKIITIAANKGGTGKTTTAHTLAAAAARDGLRTLAIDLDPQTNLTYCLGGSLTDTGSRALIAGTIPAPLLIEHTETANLDLIPAALDLVTISTGKGSGRRLEKALRTLRGLYDVIVIDTPPTPGEVQTNALQASTDLIIPLMADCFSINGLQQMAHTADMIRRTNPQLITRGYLISRYHYRKNLEKQMHLAIETTADGLKVPFLGDVRECKDAGEAAAMQQSVLEYAPKCTAAADYMAIWEKIRKSWKS